MENSWACRRFSKDGLLSKWTPDGRSCISSAALPIDASWFYFFPLPPDWNSPFLTGLPFISFLFVPPTSFSPNGKRGLSILKSKSVVKKRDSLGSFIIGTYIFLAPIVVMTNGAERRPSRPYLYRIAIMSRRLSLLLYTPHIFIFDRISECSAWRLT